MEFNRMLVIISILLSLTELRFLVLFFIPGILFFRKIELGSLMLTIGSSISFWITSFWFLEYIPISMTFLFYMTLVLSLGWLYLFQKNKTVLIEGKDIWITLVLILVVLLRLVPFFSGYSPAGADMSFHTLTTKMIALENGFPDTYAPVLPTIEFGGYPLGFHVVSGYISLLAGMTEYNATLLMANITYSLLTMMLFAFLLKHFKPRIALITSVAVTFIANNPQFFISWGGNPFVLSVAMLILGVSLLEDLFDMNYRKLALLALIMAASFLTHPMPVYGFFYIYLLVFIYRLFKEKNLKKHIRSFFVLILIFFVLLSPFLFGFNFSVSEGEQQWTRERQQTKFLSWKGNLTDFYYTIPQFFSLMFGRAFFFLVLLGFILLVDHKELFVNASVMVLSAIIVILNSEYWLLPFSYLLFSERISVLLLVPFSISVGMLIRYIFEGKQFKKLFPVKFHSFSRALIILLMLIVSYNNHVHYVRVSGIYSMVTGDDLEAFDWIQENTENNAFFINNYGDAGLWISPLTLRKSKNIQMVPIYFDETQEYLSSLEPKYVYFGKKKVYDADLDLSDYTNYPELYEKVYSKNGVTIFKIK